MMDPEIQSLDMRLRGVAQRMNTADSRHDDRAFLARLYAIPAAAPTPERTSWRWLLAGLGGFSGALAAGMMVGFMSVSAADRDAEALEALFGSDEMSISFDTGDTDG